jgi:hypothetical protein
MMKAALISALVVLMIALGMLGASCAPAQVLQEYADLTPASRAIAVNQSSKTAEAASGNPSSLHITYQPGWLAGGSLTLDGAKAQVRTFLGEPAAVLDGYFVDLAAPGVGSGGRAVFSVSDKKVFLIQRPVAGVPSPDEFTVEASTGEVVEASFHSHAVHAPSQRPVSDTEARATAEEFARTRFADFGKFSLYEAGDLALTRDNIPIYVAHWQRQAESGAWLPTLLRVGVDRATGQVVTYTAQRIDYHGPTTPTIGRDQAIEFALAEARKDARLAAAKAGRVELTTMDKPQKGRFGHRLSSST